MDAEHALYPIILIVGPTGVGKSDLALQLAQRIGGEIVNADLGQLYTPLTIGTAKPLWREENVRHHGFDILDYPVDYNVVQYRAYVQDVVDDIQRRGNVPLIVGGSSFYWNALFFPPVQSSHEIESPAPYMPVLTSPEVASASLWNTLHDIDPQRSQVVHPHDHYRIIRALSLWQTQGVLPSSVKPSYAPLRERFLIISTERPRAELSSRINQRVDSMLQRGWVNETLQLDSSWREFLLRKKLIGYDDIIRAQFNDLSEACVDRIKQRTRQYAKRQETYWRSWKKKFECVAGSYQKYYELSLTLSSFDLYLKQLHRSLNDLGIRLS